MRFSRSQNSADRFEKKYQPFVLESSNDLISKIRSKSELGILVLQPLFFLYIPQIFFAENEFFLLV